MSKCKVCKDKPAENVWQPFGPAEDARLVMAPGWHYRGFPTIAVCDQCADKITRLHEPFWFEHKYKGRLFNIWFDGTKAEAQPITTEATA